MKKVLSLLTLVVMLMAPSLLRAQVAQIFFNYKYNGTLLTNEEMNNVSSTVYLYKNGERITYSSSYYDETSSQYLNAKQEITLGEEYKGKSVAYVTDNGMRGAFTVSTGGVDALDIDLRKLTFQNLNSWVSIYNSQDRQVASLSSYNSFTFLPPADGYYYNKDGQRMPIDLSAADKEVDWSEGAPVPSQFSMRVVGHYGDFPLPDGYYWYLYKYGDQNNQLNTFYSSSTYGSSIDAGNYWLRDQTGHWSDKIVLNSPQTVFLPYQKVTFVSKTAGVPTTSGQVTVRAKNDGSSSYYYGQSADFNNKGEAVFYLQPGDYTYSSSGVKGEFTVGNKDEQVNINKYKVTITVQDVNGKKMEGAYVNFRSNDSSDGNNTDENGQVVCEDGPGTFTTYASMSGGGGTSGEKEVVVTNANAEATLTVPALVTFNVNNEGKPYDGGFSLTDEDGNWYSGSVDAGVAKFRMFADKDYYLSKGTNNIKVHITEGCTINMGYIEITSEGMGVAFPRSGLEATTTLTTIVGGVVRLTAIPVTDDKFLKWTINGTDYTDPMIDFTIKEPITTAKAVFGGSATNRASVKQEMTTINVKYDDQFVYFSADVEGSVSIYNIDGKLVKSLGVIGDRVGIYDLPQGSYVLTLTTADGAQTARFQKK